MAEDTYTVTRSVTIKSPPDAVYGNVADFHRWRRWSPWEDLDPAMARSYSGPDAGVGAVYEWSGNSRAGAGRMTIVEVDEPSAVRIDLAFDKPFKTRNEVRFVIEPSAAGSLVTWTITGPKTFVTKVMGVFRSMDKMLGPDLEKGLTRLKTVSEEPPGA
ncbi:SRPBCC family protein [Mangrovihabitans endophyticus]|nr:SRPBCC family protein [Mangrovihabitans endophyticus]